MIVTEHEEQHETGTEAQPFMSRYLSTDAEGNVSLRVPHLDSDMTEEDGVTITAWDVNEGDSVYPHDWMVAFTFQGEEVSLTIPPIGAALRVVRIEATRGQIVHLHDPLIVLSIVEPLSVTA